MSDPNESNQDKSYVVLWQPDESWVDLHTYSPELQGIAQLVWELAGEQVRSPVPVSAILVAAESRGLILAVVDWALGRLEQLRVIGSGRQRPRQTNCQVEPCYPDHETVVFSIRSPDMTAHGITSRCAIGHPHQIAECGEWRGDDAA